MKPYWLRSKNIANNARQAHPNFGSTPEFSIFGDFPQFNATTQAASYPTLNVSHSFCTYLELVQDQAKTFEGRQPCWVPLPPAQLKSLKILYLPPFEI